MGVFSYLRKVYDLDTLDTRFTSASTVPYKTVIEQRTDPVAQREAEERNRSKSQPSKWQTPEFYLYYVVFALAVPYMFWACYDVSRRECLSLLCFDGSQIWPMLTELQPRTPDITSSSSSSPTAGCLAERLTTRTPSTILSAPTCLPWACC